MIKDCNTCIHKEGSCYPSTTIFDKDKTCKSYDPDYEGYIADLEKENAELKEKIEVLECDNYNANCNLNLITDHLTKARGLLAKWVELYKPKLEGYPITPIQEQTEQFLKEIEK